MDIETVVLLVLVTSVGWLIVGWSLGYKEGVKDGFNRGRASGLRAGINRTQVGAN